MVRIVIVGASLAGATAAATLRDEGFDGEIRLIGTEPQLPYNRPPLSKGYLRHEEAFEAQLVKPAGYYPSSASSSRWACGRRRSTPGRSSWSWRGAGEAPTTGFWWRPAGATERWPSPAPTPRGASHSAPSRAAAPSAPPSSGGPPPGRWGAASSS